MIRTGALARVQLYFRPREATSLLARHLPGGRSRGVLTTRFEERFARTAGSSHAVALPMARTALRQILRHLDLPRGSEVLLTPITIPDMVNVVLQQGLRPVFVDLAPGDPNVSFDDLSAKTGPNARVLLLTHLLGFPTDMDRAVAHAREHDLVLLEDASQAPGAAWRGRPVGTFGRAGIFSLSLGKPIDTLYGGMVTTDDAELAGRLREDAGALPARPRRELAGALGRQLALWTLTRRHVFAWSALPLLRGAEAVHTERLADATRGGLPLVPFRPDPRRDRLPSRALTAYTEAQAALGLEGLRRFAVETARRRGLGLRLHDRLREAGVPGLPTLPVRGRPVFWRFPLWCEDPQGLRQHLLRHGIDAATSGLPCLSSHDGFSDVRGRTPNAEDFVERRSIHLNVHPAFTEEDVDRIARCVVAWYDRPGYDRPGMAQPAGPTTEGSEPARRSAERGPAPRRSGSATPSRGGYSEDSEGNVRSIAENA